MAWRKNHVHPRSFFFGAASLSTPLFHAFRYHPYTGGSGTSYVCAWSGILKFQVRIIMLSQVPSYQFTTGLQCVPILLLTYGRIPPLRISTDGYKLVGIPVPAFQVLLAGVRTYISEEIINFTVLLFLGRRRSGYRGFFRGVDYCSRLQL